MNELNQKSNIIEELEADIEGLNQKVERLSNEIQENSTTITNKDVIINQIKNQNENLQKDIEDKEKEMELIEKTRQKEVNEYKEQIESLMKEKNELDIYKQELTDNLYQANNKIKEMNDFISKKYNSLMESLSCEKQKNEKRRYEKIVKMLNKVVLDIDTLSRYKDVESVNADDKLNKKQKKTLVHLLTKQVEVRELTSFQITTGIDDAKDEKIFFKKISTGQKAVKHFVQEQV